MAAAVEPRPSETCANCGKARTSGYPNHSRAVGGTRMPKDLWLVSLERDPFCSARCCRSFYGLRTNTQDGLGSCPDCGKKHTIAVARPNGNRCQKCSDKTRKRRHKKHNIPGCCTGCGVEYDSYTTGCIQCVDRRRRRERRSTEPGYKDRERAYTRAAKQRRRLAAARRLAPVEHVTSGDAPGAAADLTPTKEAA